MVYTILEVIWAILGTLACVAPVGALMVHCFMTCAVETETGHLVRVAGKKLFWGFIQLAGYSVTAMLLMYGGMVVYMLVTFRSLFE